MKRALCPYLFVAALVALGAVPLPAQTSPSASNAPEPLKFSDSAKPKVTLDKIKLPPGGVVVVVEDIKEGLALLPKLILMAPEEYQKLLDRVASLEKQLKADKKTAHACKLAGRVEGDFVLLRAEFTFTTEQPWTPVVLGLQGAHLADEGELDHKVPLLEVGEEGFLVKAEKEGTHQLVLNLKIPVGFKRSAATGGGGERGFDLGLPGAAVTTMNLDLPAGVKEVRWNETLEKPRAPNHWELALGKIKTLNLFWKEPVFFPGNAPLLTSDSQITVKLDDDFVLLNADIALEDLRGQNKEWQLLLPRNAKVDVKTSTGLGFDLLYPDGARSEHIVRLAEASPERLLVKVEVRYPRPTLGARLPVGPFFALGTYRQEGTITIHAPAAALRGERLLFHSFGDIYPRDIPRGLSGADVAAIYKFWNVPGGVRAPTGSHFKAPLELELNSVKNPNDVSVDHSLQVKRGQRGWLIETTTTIRMKTGVEFLDVQLPRVPIPRFGVIGVSSAAPFPVALPWQSLAPLSGKNAAPAVPLDFGCEEDSLKMAPPDGQRKTRLTWNRGVGNEMKLTGKYLVPEGSDRLRIGLPRPVGVVERGARVRIKVPDEMDLLVGAAGFEGPALDRQQLQYALDTFPESVDILWRPHLPEFSVTGLTDVWLHDRSAEVKHQLQFTVPRRASGTGMPQPAHVRCRVPAAVRELTVVSGGKLILDEPGKEFAWILPDAEPFTRAEILLRYDFSLPHKEGQAQNGNKQVVRVPLVWPEQATREDAKVRIWSETGTKPLLADPAGAEEIWRDNGIEVVAGNEVLPALVVHGVGVKLPLTLRLTEPANIRLASLVADRGLIRAVIDEDGTQTYRARYLVRKLNARNLDIEFPLPAANCLLNVWLDKKKINNWEPLEPVPNIAQIPVQPRLYQQPIVLEIEYKLPAGIGESKRFWRTTLCAPQFRGEVFVGPVRWQVSLPYSWVGLVPGGNLDYRWGMQGWLLGPEPSVTSADLDFWLMEREGTEPSTPVSLAFAQTGRDTVQLMHLSRQMWLLLCSGSLLAIGLALVVLPLPRRVFWLVVIGLGIGVLAVGLLWPGWLPALVFGCEPGALVLLVLLSVQWMLQERYRRQLVFLPGFTRLKSNSSLIKSGGSAHRREPSTIDAPAPAASSVLPTSQSLNKGT